MTPHQPKNSFSRMSVLIMFLIFIGAIRFLWKGESANSSQSHSTNLSLLDIINQTTPTLEVKQPVVNAFTPAGYDPDAVAILPEYKSPKV